MILDNARNAIALNSKDRPIVTRLQVLITSSILPESTFSKEVKETSGLYTMKWQPRSDVKRAARGDYLLYSDILPRYNSVRSKDYADLVRQSEEVPELKFLLRWCNIDDRLYKVARSNPGVPIPVAFDAVRYDAYLRELYEKERGVPPPEGMSMISNPIIDYISVEAKRTWLQRNNNDGRVAQEIRNAAAGRRNDK